MKARVVITEQCNRKCDICCMKHGSVREQMETCSEDDIHGYSEIMITGGEPMLYPERVKHLAVLFARNNSTAKIYLYTAYFRHAIREIIPYVDGIHYTLHHPLSFDDLSGFNQFQALADTYRHRGKTFRLYIDPRVGLGVKIVPCVWARVEVKPWLDDCPLPEGERLLKLTERA